ncbi:MAG: hypothetical protein KGL39_57495, partial [Patescibacteria group bacterium]|nr:hypothetical protein [Patescibacteria group bacterium]
MKFFTAISQLESKHTLYLSILLATLTHIADIDTSLACQLIGNCSESNVFAQTSLGYFNLIPGIELKLVYFLLWLAPISYFLYRYTRSYLIASAPFLYTAYQAWIVVISNICILIAARP